MINETLSSKIEEKELTTVNRRRFVTGALVAGVGMAAFTVVPKAFSAETPMLPEADSGHDYEMPKPDAKNEKDFRTLLIGPATLSLQASKIAVDRATHKEVMRFANFELGEAIAVTSVLKDMNTPTLPPDKIAVATLEKIKSAKDGEDFDKAYIEAQLGNHEYLRDMAMSYLKNSSSENSSMEKHMRHLATITLGVFKEHVVLTKDILKML